MMKNSSNLCNQSSMLSGIRRFFILVVFIAGFMFVDGRPRLAVGYVTKRPKLFQIRNLNFKQPKNASNGKQETTEEEEEDSQILSIVGLPSVAIQFAQ
mmetsp:Transcript_24301/g.37481  ORF Transcript_24301/g.37481 Transcript_24301/m.37481 type:complete len:98 (+) Transcript_24301:116-409(+)